MKTTFLEMVFRMQAGHSCSIALAGMMMSTAVFAAGPNYQLAREIKIGDQGGWDYLSVDAVGRRLYVTHDTELVAIDIKTNSVLGKVTGLSGLHGFAIASDLGRGYATNGRDNSVSVVDLKTLQVTGKIATGQGPDAIALDTARQEVYAFNGRGQSATVIDAKTNQVVATVSLPGKPESGVADAAAKRVYVNIENASLVAVIDASTHQLLAKWPTAPCESPVGMALDAAHQRLLIGCDNQQLIMMDSATGKVLSNVAIGDGIDATAFDISSQLVFTSNGEGTVTIAHEDTPAHLSVVQTVKTVAGARTMALDPVTHNIYLSVADRQGGPAAGMAAAAPPADMGSEVPDGMAGGPPAGGGMQTDNFRVLVYTPGK